MSQRDYLEKDYYAVLGVEQGAEQSDITKAYRRLAREHHPDANPDDAQAEARFKEIGEAYQVLSDPTKRAEYDQVRELMRSGAFAGGPGGPGSPGGFGSAGFGAGGFGQAGQHVDLNDLLADMFGAQAAGASPPPRGRAQAGRRGRDLETDLTLSFDDAMAGVTTTLRVAGPAPCRTCSGSGAAPGTSVQTCATCGGGGVVTRDAGMFGFSEPCPECGGRGQRITDPCSVCGGTGAESRSREVRARIPAGVKDGARIRLKGKGEAGQFGGPAGDLYVTVRVAEHEVFGRRGDDLTLRVPVTFTEAALGTTLRVPTLDGAVTLKVPAGTQNGRTLRVRGRGVPKAKGGEGDLLVTVEVVVPTTLTRTQERMLEEYGATEPDDLRARLDRIVAQREGSAA